MSIPIPFEHKWHVPLPSIIHVHVHIFLELMLMHHSPLLMPQSVQEETKSNKPSYMNYLAKFSWKISHTSSSRASRGRKFQRKKRKNLPIECAQGDRAARCPNHFFAGRLCCVMSRDAMRCHGDELLSVVPCNGMECYELKMPLVARPRCVVRSGSVTMCCSNVLFCTTK